MIVMIFICLFLERCVKIFYCDFGSVCFCGSSNLCFTYLETLVHKDFISFYFTVNYQYYVETLNIYNNVFTLCSILVSSWKPILINHHC